MEFPEISLEQEASLEAIRKLLIPQMSREALEEFAYNLAVLAEQRQTIIKSLAVQVMKGEAYSTSYLW